MTQQLFLDCFNEDIFLINGKDAKNFVLKWHYSKTFSPYCLINLAKKNKYGELVAVSIWGYGIKPLLTIKKIFPSLEVKDYLELHRLCLRDDQPKNSESKFISECTKYIKKKFKNIKVLFSWADGIRGKPGYVYQASNWLYGGFIKSESFFNKEYHLVHPRSLSRRGIRKKDKWISFGFSKIYGYQFRYIKFLCGHAERKRLLKESPFEWNKNYPKQKDIKLWIDAGEGSRESFQPPMLKGMGQFHHPAP